MSRSVSAPSSVTNTSPCWNGDIVPGSTLRYGSNLSTVTRRPRSASSRPREAAAIPFPSEDTTPPVTKMYLVGWGLVVVGMSAPCGDEGIPVFVGDRQVLFGIDSPVHGRRGVRDTDRHPGGEGTQLFEALDPLERMGRQRHPRRQRVARIGVHADVLPDVRRALRG